MGDTGPCGPCSRDFLRHGPCRVGRGSRGLQISLRLRALCRDLEFVFMQFNRDERREMSPISLPKPSIDTGMGLERVAAVLQGVISNYDTDLFVPLLKRAAELCGVDYAKRTSPKAARGGAASLRVIADHCSGNYVSDYRRRCCRLTKDEATSFVKLCVARSITDDCSVAKSRSCTKWFRCPRPNGGGLSGTSESSVRISTIVKEEETRLSKNS